MSLLQPDERRLLTEIGFLAGARGDIASATKIFEALMMHSPSTLAPYVGLAMSYSNRGRHSAALAVLDSAAKQVEAEDRPTLNAIQALVLHLDGQLAARDAAIAASGDHPMAAALLNHPMHTSLRR